MSGTGRTLVALAAAAIVLVIATWFDTVYLRVALQDAQATFNVAGLGTALAAGSFIVAGSVLLVGALAWRAASVVVGLAYAAVGGFLAAMPLIALRTSEPALPDQLLAVTWEVYDRTRGGPLNAAATIAAAMLIAGVASLARWQRDRAAARRAVAPVPPAAAAPPSR